MFFWEAAMGRRWSWAITGYQVYGKEHSEIVKICRYAGALSVEGTSVFVDKKSSDEILDVRKQYEEAGVDIFAFHLPFSAEYDIAGFYETQRRDAVEKILNYLEKAALLGSEVCVLHPTTTSFNVEDEGLDRYLRSMEKSIEVLVPRAEKLGLTIAIENMLPGDGGYRLGSHPEHFELFAEKFAHPGLGFCLDTGHAHVSHGESGPADFFDVMSDNLVAFHLQDNSGDRDSHLAPGHGLIDWKVIFKGMSDINYSNPATIEAPPFSYGPYQTYSLDAWKGMIDETDRLADEVLLCR